MSSPAPPARPWHGLPAEVARALSPELPAAADEIIDAVRAEVPAYARSLEGAFGRGLRAGVEEALRSFVGEIESGGRVARPDVYAALGRGEMRAGRSLEALLSAYRTGARVAWRRFVAAGAAAGIPPETLYGLAEAIFAYIDELSAESAEGYALEQSATAGELQRRRRRIVALLAGDGPLDAAEAEAAASAAGWPLPARLATVVLPEGHGERVAAALGPDALAATLAERACVLVPDPDAPGRRRALERTVAARGAPAGLGPSVPWLEAALSHRRARAALALAEEGAVPDGLVVAADHAATLLLRADRRLAAELADARLGALDAERPASRTRLEATLRTWLAEQGRLAPVAARLGVHPQTVRYRVARLRDLLGPALDDPEGRFELELALRARAAASGQGALEARGEPRAEEVAVR